MLILIKPAYCVDREGQGDRGLLGGRAVRERQLELVAARFQRRQRHVDDGGDAVVLAQPLPFEAAEIIGLGEQDAAGRLDFDCRGEGDRERRTGGREAVTHRFEIDGCRVAGTEAGVGQRFILAETLH